VKKMNWALEKIRCFLVENHPDRIFVEFVLQQISTLNNIIQQLPEPTIGIGPDEAVGFTWNIAKEHFEIEIFPEHKMGLFYENYVTGDARTEKEGLMLDEFLLLLNTAVNYHQHKAWRLVQSYEVGEHTGD